MKPGIHLAKIWSDDDVIELKIDVCDGASTFSNRVYLGYDALANAVQGLDSFKNAIHGGLFDLRFGEFGPEYANGAFHARFDFAKHSKHFITAKLQSQFEEFSRFPVASESTLYLKTEPGLLDNFITELKSLNAQTREDAYLEAI